MQATPAMAGNETSDDEAMEGYDTSISSAPGGVAGADADVTLAVAVGAVASSFLLVILAPLPRASGPPPPELDSERSRSNVTTRYLTRPSPCSGIPAMASSSVRFFEAAEASLPRRPWPASLQRGNEGMALTFSRTTSETPGTGVFATTGAEHFLAQELTFILPAVLGVLPTAASCVFLAETGTGRGSGPEPHFLAACLPPARPRTATASSCAS